MFKKLAKQSPTFRIALTHLLGKRRQTLVAMLGVTFGIAVFIFQAGLIMGFQTTFIDRTINTTPNIRLYNEADKNRQSILREFDTAGNDWILVSNQKPKEVEPKIKNAGYIISDIARNPDVEGVSPFLGAQVIFRSGITQKAGHADGVNVRSEDKLFDMKQYMKEGDLIKLETMSNAIILGSGLADELGAKINDNITVVSQKGVSLSLKVVGIHESGLTEIDKVRAYVKISTAQKLLNTDANYITDINIKLRNIDKAEELAKQFQKKYNTKAEDWKAANANIFGIFKVQNMVTYLVIVSILIVSGFGIFNIQMMIIYEKMGDIAILKAIGYKDRDIKKIFLSESIVIGIIGGLFGLILGYVVSLIVESIPLNVNGFISVNHLTFNRDPILFVLAFAFGIIATSIAGYLPARKAAKVDPVGIIRGQ